MTNQDIYILLGLMLCDVFVSYGNGTSITMATLSYLVVGVIQPLKFLSHEHPYMVWVGGWVRGHSDEEFHTPL